MERFREIQTGPFGVVLRPRGILMYMFDFERHVNFVLALFALGLR